MRERLLAWTSGAREDYLYWQTQDRKTVRRINLLLADVLRDDPVDGIGTPEPLKHALAGAWSRRIDEANRLVYVADDARVTILQARYHY
ncbi:Txe/YoeB family addiction module toxin [Microbacterium sp. P26]|uniref:Txe/YoeB family addiction module toxin n=1 Tax=Microbacterium TaxID=33882 RepID=UPI00203BF196|nr:Txe/YoeB family addiction module toxin [Microbacterium sp. P26]MCM3503337.1 Txe/YoeB family addiction module toxin [Microbacterium sp. P26]